MLVFHATLHARPPSAGSLGPAVKLRGETYATHAWTPAHAATQFSARFEDAIAALDRLDGMFTEPDGAFLWKPCAATPGWQVEGELYDRQGRLQHVDLRGACPTERFDDLLRAFGWPEQRVLIQDTATGIFLEEPEFRRWATEQGACGAAATEQ